MYEKQKASSVLMVNMWDKRKGEGWGRILSPIMIQIDCKWLLIFLTPKSSRKMNMILWLKHTERPMGWNTQIVTQYIWKLEIP